MKKKWTRFSLWNLVLAIAIFILSYVIYHHFTPSGVFTLVFQEEAGKPFVTMLLAFLGVLCLFAGITGGLVAKIFYSNETESAKNIQK